MRRCQYNWIEPLVGYLRKDLHSVRWVLESTLSVLVVLKKNPFSHTNSMVIYEDFQDFRMVVSKSLLSSSFSMSFYEFLRTSRGQLNPVARPAT